MLLRLSRKRCYFTKEILQYRDFYLTVIRSFRFFCVSLHQIMISLWLYALRKAFVYHENKGLSGYGR